MAKRTCGVPECDRPHYGDGYCNAHWRRWKRTGIVGNSTIRGQRAECTVDQCADPQSARGYCASHYARWRRSGDPGAAFTTRRRNPAARDADGRKQCRRCDAWCPEGEFHKSSTTTDGLVSECKRCHRDIGLLRRYGVDLAWYEETLASQGGTCAICGTPPGSKRSMHVDHDHAHCEGDRGCRECARGILCTRCNTGIGMFGEDPARLTAALAYVRSRHG